MANDEENFSGVQTKDADLMAVFLQFKKHILKCINVASIAELKTIDTVHKTATVQLFPQLEDEADKNIECSYLSKLEEELSDGHPIVLVLFCDRNFLAALKKLRKNQKTAKLKENVDLHSDRYGIIIGTLNFTED